MNAAHRSNYCELIRDSQGGGGECSSASSSLYPRALCQVTEMQGTTSQSGDQSNAQTLSHFRLGQLYHVDPQNMQSVKEDKEEMMESREHTYLTTKAEDHGHAGGVQEMNVNASSSVVSSSSEWQSAFQSVNPSTSMAPSSSGVLNSMTLNQV